VRIVAQGDTLEASAGSSTCVEDIVWSNPGLRLPLAWGAFEVGAGRGVVITVRRGDAGEPRRCLRCGVQHAARFNGIRGPELTLAPLLVIQWIPPQGPNLKTGAPADPSTLGSSCVQFLARRSANRSARHRSRRTVLSAGMCISLPASICLPSPHAIVAAARRKSDAQRLRGLLRIRVEVTDSFGLVEVYAHMSRGRRPSGRSSTGQKIGLSEATGLSMVRICTPARSRRHPDDPGPLIAAERADRPSRNMQLDGCISGSSS